jgi:hypothetical protein
LKKGRRQNEKQNPEFRSQNSEEKKNKIKAVLRRLFWLLDAGF